MIAKGYAMTMEKKSLQVSRDEYVIDYVDDSICSLYVRQFHSYISSVCIGDGNV